MTTDPSERHLPREIARRRTFAIISHPDAGKTTLTEKLLLYGGAIQQAGNVKARGDRRRARSDWMKIEQDRGISVTASVMTFEYDNIVFNLLDTPGHADFSEDTYRTLSAVDSAIMVLDAAKGIEGQTRKLFEVCRLRDVPIITFINKLDRESQDPFALLSEIEETLALDVSPVSWPVGMGDRFRGCYQLTDDQLVLMQKGKGDTVHPGEACEGLDDPLIDERIGEEMGEQLREEVEMARGLCPAFDLQSYREGHMTPVFFGSALYNFGVAELLAGLVRYAPPPQPHRVVVAVGEKVIQPSDEKVRGFVFKIQANMDPRHRDRIAFVRLCSGHFRRGMKLRHPRSGKTMTISNPLMFMARAREVAQEAWAGDIVGIPNHGGIAIGDALLEGEEVRFTGIPSFAPELLQAVRSVDPMRSKHLGRALMQLAQEGAASVFRPHHGANWIVGVMGALQFEVLAERISSEYNIPVIFESTPHVTARWVVAADQRADRDFINANVGATAEDHVGDTVFLARNDWHLERAQKDFPDLKFMATREHVRA